MKKSFYLEAICRELNIGFQQSNPNDILSQYKSYTQPNVKNGLDLAHLLIDCNHLEYYPEERLELEDNVLIEEFIERCSELTMRLKHVEADE